MIMNRAYGIHASLIQPDVAPDRHADEISSSVLGALEPERNMLEQKTKLGIKSILIILFALAMLWRVAVRGKSEDVVLLNKLKYHFVDVVVGCLDHDHRKEIMNTVTLSFRKSK